MGNAGRNGGEYYTPRPLIKSIVKVVNPIIGETVYDGAVGSAGFLCEAYSHMRSSKELSASEYQQLQSHTLYGKEKKSLAYVIGIMNMILHGIEAPNIVHTNTLNENIADIQQKDRVDVVLANPPFGGKERAEVQQNFPVATSETAYLFLQHFIKMLKVNGRCGVVIKNTFLSNTDNASVALRKQLLEECNLFAVLDLPGGAFIGTGVKTVVLFFEKGKPTENVWYYQLNVGKNLGKTNPLNERHMAEFVEMAKTQELSDTSWLLDVTTVNKDTWDLTVNNPNTVEEIDNRTPQEIIAEIEQLDVQSAQALQAIKDLL
jgi:type I restriction enzyme M protein